LKNIKKEIIKSFIFSGIGLIVLLFILYKSINNFIVKQEVSKARLLAHTLVYTREYLAKVAPFVEIKNPTFHPFAITPAYAVTQIAKLLKLNEHIYVKQTSDKYRNLYNKPNSYELFAINYFKHHPNANEFFELHKQHKNVNYEYIFYAYPLKIKKSCLKCHGDKKEVPKKILLKIEKLYGDRAFGYKVGDIKMFRFVSLAC